MTATERAIERWGAAACYRMLTKKDQTWWAGFWKRRKARRLEVARQRKAIQAAMRLDAARNGNV